MSKTPYVNTIQNECQPLYEQEILMLTNIIWLVWIVVLKIFKPFLIFFQIQIVSDQ